MLRELIRIYRLLFKWKRLLIILLLLVGVFTSLVMLSVPKTYDSYALIQPVASSESTGILGVLSGLTGNSNTAQSETSLLLSVFSSRSLLEAVIDEFNLMDVFDAEIREELVRGLWEDYHLELTDHGGIHLSFKTRTNWFSTEDDEIFAKVLSKDILDFIVQYADNKNVTLKTQSARFQREFLERRFSEALSMLDSLESQLQTFEEDFGIVSIDDQFSGAIQISTELKQNLVEIESQIYVAEKTLFPDNPKFKELLATREAILEQVRQNESLDPTRDSYNLDRIFPVFSKMPGLSIRYKHLVMELETHFKILEYLGTQLEEAKLREAKDTPTIQIIDSPSLPELRSSPQRTLTVVVTGLAAFMILAMFIYLIETYAREKNGLEEDATLENMLKMIKSLHLE